MPKMYECLGGPLCGKKVENPFECGGFAHYTGDGVPYFYRLVRIQSRRGGATATFFHYFGNNPERAKRADPTLVPHHRLFRSKKKK